MEDFYAWIKDNINCVGFGITARILLFALLLFARQIIGFFPALLLLCFSLIIGFFVIYHQSLADKFRPSKNAPLEISVASCHAYNEWTPSLTLVIPKGDEYWICPHCHHKNSHAFTICQDCGWGQITS